MSLRNNIDKKGEKDEGRISCYTGNDPNNVKQILSNDCTSFSRPATIFGQEREVLARSVYEKKYVLLSCMKSGKVKTTGFIFDPNIPLLGVSLARILQCNSILNRNS